MLAVCCNVSKMSVNQKHFNQYFFLDNHMCIFRQNSHFSNFSPTMVNNFKCFFYSCALTYLDTGSHTKYIKWYFFQFLSFISYAMSCKILLVLKLTIPFFGCLVPIEVWCGSSGKSCLNLTSAIADTCELPLLVLYFNL